MPSQSVPASPNPSPMPAVLEPLVIPGMTQNVPGYDGGIPEWLFASGLTAQVNNTWAAQPGDMVTVGEQIDPFNIRAMAVKQLEPGDELHAHFFFSLPQKELPDGEIKLGYVLHRAGGLPGELSLPLNVLIKTDLPGGPDIGHLPEEGHPALSFSLSALQIYPPEAARGVIAIIEPYPNMHAQDVIHFQWGGLTILQPVEGVGQQTHISISHGQIVEAGDSYGLLVNFYPVDLVGNPSVQSSRYLEVVVDLAGAKPDGPAIITDDPLGYIDPDRLNGESLQLELYTTAQVGKPGDLYDITFRAYPPLGGVVTYRGFEEIVRAGVPVNHPVPYSVVRAAAGGKIETSFVLRKRTEPSDLVSQKTFARVRGSVVRLAAAFFERYPGHVVAPIPDSAIVSIPWYPWCKPTDGITVILRYVKSLNETIVFSEPRVVGTSWADGAPIRRLIYRKDLERFEGFSPELYYVYESAQVRARSLDLNESVRQRVQIG
ncbi:hypothetical protein ACUN0G_29375 [Pseudomonas sp. 32A]|uniref:hypothetical protein n=1 Tax=Pseudomonas sp. 32A TaxID=651185 RepID=UPI0040461FC7